MYYFSYQVREVYLTVAVMRSAFMPFCAKRYHMQVHLLCLKAECIPMYCNRKAQNFCINTSYIRPFPPERTTLHPKRKFGCCSNNQRQRCLEINQRTVNYRPELVFFLLNFTSTRVIPL